MSPDDLIEKCDCGSPAHTAEGIPRCDCGNPATRAVVKNGILQALWCHICLRRGRGA